LTQRITRKIAEANLGYLNELLNEIGSDYRFGIEHPWSLDFLGLTTKGSDTWIKSYNQCGYRDINNAATMLYDFLFYLKQEKLFKKGKKKN
jgi:hypothetical protein